MVIVPASQQIVHRPPGIGDEVAHRRITGQHDLMPGVLVVARAGGGHLRAQRGLQIGVALALTHGIHQQHDQARRGDGAGHALVADIGFALIGVTRAEQHRAAGSAALMGQIQVSRNIDPRAGLEDDLLDVKDRPRDGPGHLRAEGQRGIVGDAARRVDEAAAHLVRVRLQRRGRVDGPAARVPRVEGGSAALQHMGGELVPEAVAGTLHFGKQLDTHMTPFRVSHASQGFLPTVR